MQKSDEELFSSWRSGDTICFDQIHKRHANSVLHLLRFLGAEREAAESLTQETFLRLIRARDQFDATRKFSTWLFSIARNLWRDELRSRRSRTSTYQALAEEMVPTSVQAEVSPARHAEAKEQYDRLYRAMDDLEDIHKEVLALRFLQGLGAGDIAEVLDIPAATVHTRLHRGIERLRRLMRG